MLREDDLSELLAMLNTFDAAGDSMHKEAERVKTVRGVGIFVYGDEGKHNTPHFHARFNSDEGAVFQVIPLRVMPGTESTLRKAHEKAVIKWASGPKPNPDADPNAPPVVLRQQALLQAWNQ